MSAPEGEHLDRTAGGLGDPADGGGRGATVTGGLSGIERMPRAGISLRNDGPTMAP